MASFEQSSIAKRRKIEACIYGCRIIKRKSVFLSKQLGINCTCEQIGLFLISTRGCGSHSWKLLKSPICSRVQLIPNCFSNRPISYTNDVLNRQQNRPRHPIVTVPKKETILVLPYLGVQSKIVTKQLKTCINKFYG